MVGARPLHKLFSETRLALQTPNGRTTWPEWRDRLVAEIASSSPGIDELLQQLPPAPEPGNEEFDAATLLHTLERLLPWLERQHMEAVTLYDAIPANAPFPDASLATALRQAMEQFAFARAAECCRALIEKLQGN